MWGPMGIFDKLRGKAAGPAKVTDPICGMTIDPTGAAGKSTFEGQTYHFCSAGCKREFDADPRRHLGKGT